MPITLPARYPNAPVGLFDALPESHLAGDDDLLVTASVPNLNAFTGPSVVLGLSGSALSSPPISAQAPPEPSLEEDGTRSMPLASDVATDPPMPLPKDDSEFDSPVYPSITSREPRALPATLHIDVDMDTLGSKSMHLVATAASGESLNQFRAGPKSAGLDAPSQRQLSVDRVGTGQCAGGPDRRSA